MSTPIPVPSKAALTALRGLIVGTTCTLALVTEDRRRRINNARSAIRNAEKIRSAKQYHSDGAALALALQDDDLSDVNIIHWRDSRGAELDGRRRTSWVDSTRRKTSHDRSRARQSHTTGHSLDSQPGHAGAHDALHNIPPKALRRHIAPPQFAKPLSKERPVQDGLASGIRSTTEVIDADAELEVVAFRVREACTSNDVRRMDRAVDLLSDALTSVTYSRAEKEALFQSGTLLSNTLQELGRFDSACRLLECFLQQGPINENAYLALNPLPIITSMIASCDDRHALAKAVSRAAHLFLPRLTETPEVWSSEKLAVGKSLVENACAVKHFQVVKDLCRRAAESNQYSFLGWCIAKLRENRESRLSVDLFLSCYATTEPTRASYDRTGRTILEALHASHNYKAGDVLQVLLRIRPQGSKLTTEWVTTLLYGFWKRYNDLEKVNSLFNELVKGNLSETVTFPDGAYRTIIQVNLEAKNQLLAKSYFADLKKAFPNAKYDPRVLGLFALEKAKAQDWQGVRDDFEQMGSGERRGDVFVPVLKEYLKSHTIGETETFLRAFVQDLEVPLCAYAVTLMADEYAALRDVKALSRWLDFCIKAGCQVDATISRSILISLKKRWRLSFSQLLHIHRQLERLSPDFVGSPTEKFMRQAAASDSRAAPKQVVHRLSALRISVSNLRPLEEQASVAMHRALAVAQPRSALAIYNRAVHDGMSCSDRCLLLAVRAGLLLDRHNPKAAIRALRQAQEAGQDISSAMLPLLTAKIDEIHNAAVKRGDGDAQAELREFITSLESQGLKMLTPVLNRAAGACLKLSNYQAALGFIRVAMVRSGQTGPGNPTLFGLLASTYAGLAYEDGMRWIIQYAIDSGYGHDPACLWSLKRSRERLRRQPDVRNVRSCLGAVEDGISKLTALKKEASREKEELRHDVIRIMEQAAINASGPERVEGFGDAI